MIDKAPGLPKIHHIQIKLSSEEYELFSKAAHAAMMHGTPYAREIFIATLKKEQVRLGLAAASKKRA